MTCLGLADATGTAHNARIYKQSGVGLFCDTRITKSPMFECTLHMRELRSSRGTMLYHQSTQVLHQDTVQCGQNALTATNPLVEMAKDSL